MWKVLPVQLDPLVQRDLPAKEESVGREESQEEQPTLASLEDPDPRVRLESRDTTVSREKKEAWDWKERMETQASEVQLVPMERMERWAHRVLPAFLVRVDLRERRENMETWVLLDSWDLLGCQDLQDTLASRATKVTKENQRFLRRSADVKAFTAPWMTVNTRPTSLAHQDLQDLLEMMALQDKKETEAMMELRALLVPRERRATSVLWDSLAQLETLAQLVVTDLLVCQVRLVLLAPLVRRVRLEMKDQLAWLVLKVRRETLASVESVAELAHLALTAVTDLPAWTHPVRSALTACQCLAAAGVRNLGGMKASSAAPRSFWD